MIIIKHKWCARRCQFSSNRFLSIMFLFYFLSAWFVIQFYNFHHYALLLLFFMHYIIVKDVNRIKDVTVMNWNLRFIYTSKYLLVMLLLRMLDFEHTIPLPLELHRLPLKNLQCFFSLLSSCFGFLFSYFLIFLAPYARFLSILVHQASRKWYSYIGKSIFTGKP